MTEAMPFLQKYDITFLRPPTIVPGDPFCIEILTSLRELCETFMGEENSTGVQLRCGF